MKPTGKLAALPAAAVLKTGSEALVASLRAYLLQAIAAGPGGAAKRQDAQPDALFHAHCCALAELPDAPLARVLSGAVGTVLQRIQAEATACQIPLLRSDGPDGETRARYERILEQLDVALAWIIRDLEHPAFFRAEVTQSGDLLCEATSLAIGDGPRAARLIRRGMEMSSPLCAAGGVDGFAEAGYQCDFAWDTYQRVGELDRLADDFPTHIKWAARQMHAWPMLAHRHADNRRRFEELADRLELGAEHPLDASAGARSRPDTPMVRYLRPVIQRLHEFWCMAEGQEYASAEAETDALRKAWWHWPDPLPDETWLAVLRVIRRLPPLTKATALAWTEQAVVPVILLTNARDPAACQEPVLQRIWRQKGVKTRATFKSRLLAAVAASLKRLARPA